MVIFGLFFDFFRQLEVLIESFAKRKFVITIATTD